MEEHELHRECTRMVTTPRSQGVIHEVRHRLFPPWRVDPPSSSLPWWYLWFVQCILCHRLGDEEVP